MATVRQRINGFIERNGFESVTRIARNLDLNLATVKSTGSYLAKEKFIKRSIDDNGEHWYRCPDELVPPDHRDLGFGMLKAHTPRTAEHSDPQPETQPAAPAIPNGVSINLPGIGAVGLQEAREIYDSLAEVFGRADNYNR